jgi:hypothetical protein
LCVCALLQALLTILDSPLNKAGKIKVSGLHRPLAAQQQGAVLVYVLPTPPTAKSQGCDMLCESFCARASM